MTSAIGLASAGCGEGDDSNESWVAATNEEFAVAWGKAVCRRRVRSCCERDGVTFDEEACAEAYANEARENIERVTDGGRALNLRYASFCVLQIEASAPDCGLDQVPSPLPPGLSARHPHCAFLFDPPHGSAAPGELCAEQTDCVATGAGYVNCVQRRATSAKTTCYVTAPGREGDVCDVRDQFDRGEEVGPFFHHCEWANGLYCDAHSKRCAHLRLPGALCHTHHECVDGSYCAGCKANEPCAVGVCTPYLGLDQACDPAANLICGRGMYCDAASGHCVLAAGRGEPCGNSLQCWGECIEGVCEGGFLTLLAQICGGTRVTANWTGSY